MLKRVSHTACLVTVAIALALVLTAPAFAVQKVVLFESFGATW